jgi:hypothetical protein
MTSNVDRHLSEEELLRCADGELDGPATERARLHLDACWGCRTHLEDIQALIREVVHVRQDLLLPSIPPPAQPWPGLQSRLDEIDAQMANASAFTRLRMTWTARAFASWRWAAACVVAAAVAAAVLRREEVVSAKELLARATETERIEQSTGSHRRLLLEARRLPGRDLVLRRRINIWHRGDGGQARRVYDEQERLIAGEWLSPDGDAAVYRRGRPSEHVRASRPPRFTEDDLWRIEPSATQFAALTPNASSMSVNGDRSRYTVTYRAADASVGLTEGSLTLARQSLHPIETRLEVALDGHLSEIRVVEADYVSLGSSAIPSAVFTADSELNPVEPAPAVAPRMSRPASPVSARDLAALELDVVNRLDTVDAFLGEQVAVTRTRRPGVDVEALVDSAARKQELLRALQPLRRQPLLRVDVTTVEEALRQRQSSRREAPSIRSLDVASDAAPLHEHLRSHFARSGSDPRTIEESIRRFTTRALDHSLQARLQARAATQLVERFTPTELEALPPNQLAVWRAGLDRHVSAFQRETEALRRQLEPLFFSPSPVDEIDDDTPVSVTTLAQASARLFSLGSSHDVTIGHGFAASVDGAKADAVASPAFWQSLRRAERLAARLHAFLSDR